MNVKLNEINSFKCELCVSVSWEDLKDDYYIGKPGTSKTINVRTFVGDGKENNIQYEFVDTEKILENKEWGNDLLSSANVWKDEIIKNFSFPVQGDSHILSIIVGQEEKAIYLQKYLEENGFLAIAIRPPTVPVGQSRIRITIRRNLDFNLLNNFIAVLKEFK